MTRNKLYVLLSAACVTGYFWLYFFQERAFFNLDDVDLCLFKHVTSLPCPSCGSTRAVLELFHGNLAGAFLFNPIGYLISIILVIIPFWVIFDLITAKSSLYIFYQQAECFIRRKMIAIPLIFIVIINWIWNICKGV